MCLLHFPLHPSILRALCRRSSELISAACPPMSLPGTHARVTFSQLHCQLSDISAGPSSRYGGADREMELQKVCSLEAGPGGTGLAGGDVRSRQCLQNLKTARSKRRCEPRWAVSTGPRIRHFNTGRIHVGNCAGR